MRDPMPPLRLCDPRRAIGPAAVACPLLFAISCGAAPTPPAATSTSTAIATSTAIPGPTPTASSTPTPTSTAAPDSTVVVLPPPADAPPETAPAAIAGPVSASGWTTFHGDAARTGASAARPIASPRIRWKTKVGIQSWLNGPLALGAEIAVVPSCGEAHNKPDPGDGVHALDLRTGRRLWHAHFDQDANGAAAAGDRVVATSDDGNAYAIDLRRGAVLWKAAGKGKMYTHPLVVGDRVVVGDAGGWVRAIALADGRELWRIQLVGSVRGGASADGGTIYVVSQGGETAAITPDGKVVWRKTVHRPPWGGQGRDVPIEAYSPPVVAADAIVVPFARDTYYTGLPGLMALDRRNGSVRWRATGSGDWGNVRSTPALAGGALVWGEPYSGDVAAASASTGRPLWRVTVGPCYFPQWASPAAAGDVVYVPRFDGSVYAVRAATGKVLWEIYLGDAATAGRGRAPAPAGPHGCEWDVPRGFPIYSPAAVAADGTLLVGTGEGYLYAIEGT